MREWLQLATSGPVVRRAFTYGVVVGAILIAINHADAILQGSVTPVRIGKMVLTVMVPYCVSTLSSVGAMRQIASGEGTRADRGAS
jgi:hypothetical protein